jgi:hypothetical protein
MERNILRADATMLTATVGDDAAAAATVYATAGFPVFPLHTAMPLGECSCARPCGRDAGKHPRTAHGLIDATTDPTIITDWWRRWPEANLAVATGPVAGLVVLDVDAGAGDESIARLEAVHGELPPTWAVETGGGGLHLWYHHTGTPVPSRVGKLGPGLDVRGVGGYVVVPPSLHRSGTRYQWGAAWHPAKLALAPLPAWLRMLMTADRNGLMIPPEVVPLGVGVGGNHHTDTPPSILEGARNASLTTLAGVMRRRGCGEEAIRAALLAENAARCVPPLAPIEVERIARSVARYAPEPAPPAIRGRARGAFVEFVGGQAVTR